MKEQVYCPRCKLQTDVVDGVRQGQCLNEFCAEPYQDILGWTGRNMEVVIPSRDPVNTSGSSYVS